MNFKHDIVNIGDIPKQLSAVVQVAAEQVSTQRVNSTLIRMYMPDYRFTMYLVKMLSMFPQICTLTGALNLDAK